MDFLSIRLNTVRPGILVPFNVYIKVADSFKHYLNEGDDFDQVRFDKLKSKGLKKFHIQQADEIKYQEFLSSILDNIHLESNDVKISIALDVSENSAQAIMVNPANEKSYSMAKSSSEIVHKVLADNDVILRQMVAQGRNSNSNLAERMQGHLVNTASIAIKFAATLKTNINISSLGTAAFYHDVSFTQYSSEEQKFFFKEIKSMSVGELSIYKTHPEKSVMTLQDKSFAEPEVLALIMAHEENLSGVGFPKKLTKLTQTQEILSLCAFYDREVSCLGKDPLTIYENIIIDQVGNYSLDLLKKFKTFMKSYL